MSFLIFAFNEKEPKGGILDLVGHYKTLDAAYNDFPSSLQQEHTMLQIFNTENNHCNQAKLSYKVENGIIFWLVQEIGGTENININDYTFNTNKPN